MKTMFLTPPKFKAFTIGVGVSVGGLTLTFLLSFYAETRDKIRSASFKPVRTTTHQPVYIEVHGMD